MHWWRRSEREQDLERELRSDLEMEAAEREEEGLSVQEARYAAHRAFGNVNGIKEEVREMWNGTGWEIFTQDVRYAFRTLRKSPGFAATAILTLALSIGASTAVFTVVDSVLLKPLSYRDSGRLVVAWESVRFLSGEPTGPNPRHVDVWRKRATAFRGLTYLQYSRTGLTFGSEHPQVVGSVGSLPDLFDILQVKPMLGRMFIEQDGVKGRSNVVVLTYPLWQSAFHGDPGVIGKTIRMGDVPREVVGVLPATFHFPNANSLRSTRSHQPVSGVSEPALFFPVALDVTQFGWNGNYGNWIAVGRLKPGITVGNAEAELNTITAQMVREMPANQGDRRPGALLASVRPMQEAVVGDSRVGLWFLMAAVIGLMLIACLNLANAQLGRALSRRRESAVRAALGAAKWRLVWNALAESLVLSVIGGTAGVAIAFSALDLLRRYAALDVPRLSEIAPSGNALLFSILLALAASLLSGIPPALRLLSSDPQTALQQSTARALGSRQSNRLRTWLIALQVFGCTALLLVTGLFSKSLLHLLRQDKGFETGQVAVAEVGLSPKTFPTDGNRIGFDDGVLQNLRALPGVTAAGLISAMPLEGESWIEPVMRVDRPQQETPLINFRWASPGYFETTGQKLIAGRFLEERDRTLNSAVVSESEAKAVWQDENPLGGQIRVEGRTFTVIGVVADSRNVSLKSAPPKMVYVHYKDRPPYATFFLVRASGSVEAVLAGMREAIWKYAPDVTISRVKTLDSQVADSLTTERFQTSILIAFGVAALLLAMLGIYGVLSYSVSTRKQEFGLRMALGASRANIYSLTFGEAGLPILVGMAGGLLASILAARVVKNLLFGVQTVDPIVIVIVTTLFTAAAVSAAYLPARRAASVDPMEALRSE